MMVNKKLGRFKQWAGERMGGEVKTNVSDDFKAMEAEMTLRHEGMDRLQKSMTSYVKTLSKRNEGEDKEKVLPVTGMGTTMLNHGEEFEQDSEFGNCLIGLGRANERIGRTQETYVQNATSSWLESLERSLAQMKEYQSARKKLENRRLAYDASMAKMQKAKREDFRVEEELRSQKAKYEESSEEVVRRMEDIKDAEAESVQDLGAFLDAELQYYDRCRDILLQLKENWPADRGSPTQSNDSRRSDRARGNAAQMYTTRAASPPEKLAPRQSIRSNRAPSAPSTRPASPGDRDDYPVRQQHSRPSMGRSTTFEGPTKLHRDTSPIGSAPMSRVPTDPTQLANLRSNLRSADVFSDQSDDNFSSPDRSYGERSTSPATSYGSNTPGVGSRRAPPPPPPSRAKKPPPPPPTKRSGLSSGNVMSG